MLESIYHPYLLLGMSILDFFGGILRHVTGASKCAILVGPSAGHRGIAPLQHVPFGVRHIRGEAPLRTGSRGSQEGRMGAVPAPVFAFVRDGLCRLFVSQLMSSVSDVSTVNESKRTEMTGSTLQQKIFLKLQSHTRERWC